MADTEDKRQGQAEKPRRKKTNPTGTIRDPSEPMSIYLSQIRDLTHPEGQEYADLTQAISEGRAAREKLETQGADLTEAERGDLVVACQKGQEAANELAVRNLHFVLFCVKPYANQGVPYPDLVCEANLALVEAALNFDPNRGRFTTYAAKVIRTRLYGMTSRERWGPITQSASTVQAYAAIKAKEDRAAILGEDLSLEDLSRETGLSQQKIQEVQAAWENTRMISTSINSFDAKEAPDGTDQLRKLEETLQGDDENAVLDDMQSKDRHETLIQVMREVLTPIEEACLVLLFGLEDGNPQRLSVVSEELGFAKTGTRQICERAKEKIRQANARYNLIGGLFGDGI